ncbi:SOS response-associated peptidase [Caldisalinibacter kiritimatiensis]|uniref:Abasic site processing protein n=1 Tax=Caldisalinibacter kiritimatiensis TaxID=1304284 RepID=R1CLM2_9FIRM|nr:SOS response-associated peptidase [Caldisalinibacter kiritimatiensis]EOC99595.1 hypothetical protein L21TH_2368 [Caldisalinibacter kiritimatiensis]
MCGRYYLNLEIDDIMKRYGIFDLDIDFSPKNEIFPSQESIVVIGQNTKEIKLLKWGFAPSFTKRLIINARSETVDKKPTFRDSFIRRRCIIPANGFFEWENNENKSIKRRIRLKDNSIFSIAGIYNTFKDKNGEYFEAFTILTTEANKDISRIHNRIPVIIHKDKEDMWLDHDIKDLRLLKELMKSYKGELVVE